jgi:choline dehydrogenase-like flavoprotein
MADKTVNVKTKRELILSSGAINTPTLLLKSGIGDSSILKGFNIPVVKHLPGVGKNVSDHPAVTGSWDRPNTTDTLAQINATSALQQWTTTRTGPFANGLTSQAGFFRMNASSPSVKELIKKWGDITSGPQTPDFQLQPVNNGPFTLSVVLVSPHSRGSISLNPQNPLSGMPRIDLGIYTSPADIEITYQALLKLIRLTTAPSLKRALGAPLGGIKTLIESGMDKKVVEEYIRSSASTIHHVSGSCQMSKRGEETYGVVDPDLGLRV